MLSNKFSIIKKLIEINPPFEIELDLFQTEQKAKIIIDEQYESKNSSVLISIGESNMRLVWIRIIDDKIYFNGHNVEINGIKTLDDTQFIIKNDRGFLDENIILALNDLIKDHYLFRDQTHYGDIITMESFDKFLSS